MNRDLSQDAEINVAMGQVGITLSGVLGDGTGLPGYVTVYDANWAQVGNAQADSTAPGRSKSCPAPTGSTPTTPTGPG